MQVIKHRGNVIGAKLTKAEQKAMDIEMDKAWAAHMRNNHIDYDSTILYVLMQAFDFTEDQLHKFFNSFNAKMDELIEYYEMDEKDQFWLCRYMLQQKGIDLEAWDREYELHKEEIDHAVREEHV